MTNAAPRPTRLQVTARPYERAHGRAPRGRGSWAFAPATNWTAYDAEVDYDAVRFFNGTYTEARAAAVASFTETPPARPAAYLAALS